MILKAPRSHASSRYIYNVFTLIFECLEESVLTEFICLGLKDIHVSLQHQFTQKGHPFIIYLPRTILPYRMYLHGRIHLYRMYLPGRIQPYTIYLLGTIHLSAQNLFTWKDPSFPWKNTPLNNVFNWKAPSLQNVFTSGKIHPYRIYLPGRIHPYRLLFTGKDPSLQNLFT